jgi:Tfp pilus assembly protein PilF
VRKRTLWISGLTLACGTMAVVAALAAVPPNLGKAIEVQRRLTTERPQDAAVFNDLGNLLVLAGQPAEAETAYRKAVELAPDKVSALFNLGVLQQQRGERREALRLFEQVLELQPNHAWAWYQIGALHERWEQEARAIEAYAKAFQIDPQLTFPEVNPHIVENGLVTRAMLRAYQEGASVPQAPAMYDEPARIVGLLVPRPTPQSPANGAQDQTAAEAPQGGQARPVQGGAAGRPGQPNVIREGDLDRRSTGQASPQGRRSMPGSRPSTPMPRGLRTWERPEPTTIEEQPVYEEGGGDPGQVITPPPGGVYYRPGLQSTGRLNLQLLKNRGDRDGRG